MNKSKFRTELKKIMPGYKWTVHKSSDPEYFLDATGIMTSGFNRTSTLQVIKRKMRATAIIFAFKHTRQLSILSAHFTRSAEQSDHKKHVPSGFLSFDSQGIISSPSQISNHSHGRYTYLHYPHNDLAGPLTLWRVCCFLLQLTTLPSNQTLIS